jgi:hypothetical protein
VLIELHHDQLGHRGFEETAGQRQRLGLAQVDENDVSPGQQLPGYVITPQNSWGTGVITPGTPPTYIVPNNAGGTAIVTPGYGPTLIRPNPAGGTTIIGPDQGTTVIAPTRRGGGGSVIVGPGGTGYLVPTPQGTYIQPPGSVPPAVIYRP